MNISVCKQYDIACLALADETLGVLGWVGFVLGVLGLGVTIWQLLKLKSASEHVKHAVDRLSAHVDSVNLAYLSAQMNTITHLVQRGDYGLAQVVFIPIKRTLRLHANSRDLDADSLDSLKRTLGKIDKQIEWGRISHPKFSQTAANRLIDDLLSEVTLWESAVSGKSRKEIQIENA
ncbi:MULTISPECIES: hypothetical protein [unclassified Rhizobium]|uniref:hypothetical protein n=1 Tax=unclassified Rhizobium TaxID=2613769 RepID=UPI00146E215C|nr:MULTISPECIES: hypothetical protein [unclassified Rhizobium]MBD9445739.1 hypothetical protein [Rhizobium sp. RHZ01]NMN73838.1 hypothetical protein [Rhizobium sp. 57MFTsu3.2]